MTRRSKIIRRLAFASPFVVIALWAALTVFSPRRPQQARFTLDKTTTHAEGPVDSAGYVDYATALNQRLSAGIKPADNANVLLWQVLGPHPEGATMPPGYFRWLGVSTPPERGDYFIPEAKFFKAHPELDQPKHAGAFDPNVAEAQSRPWRATEFPGVAAWLNANARPLELAIEATHRPQYFNPLVPYRGPDDMQGGLVSALLPNVQKCRELTIALVCRAMLALQEGRTNDAWRDLLACHRLARLVARGGMLIEVLVGIAIDTVASQADLALLTHGHLDARRIRRCLDELQQLPPFPDVASKVDLTERSMFLDCVMMLMRHGAPYFSLLKAPPLESGSLVDGAEKVLLQWRLNTVNWDIVLREGNDWYDRLVAALRIKDRPARRERLDSFTRELKAMVGRTRSAHGVLRFISGDDRTVGDFLVILMLPAIEKVQQASDRINQIQNNLQIAFALAAYRQDDGRYPANLSDLEPKYLPRVPLDIFSSKPLRYRPTADDYLLYSVGVNGKDEQGRSYEDDPPGDDLRVRMPLRAKTRADEKRP